MSHSLLLLAVLVLIDLVMVVVLTRGLRDSDGRVFSPQMFTLAVFLICMANVLMTVAIVLYNLGGTP